ncbi:MAG: L-aspartate oxidase [Spirochaetales bacterium]|nr:L-aspartate oxidase [Spirochaetales bacterium]
MIREYDVVIIGSGISGLTCGLKLAKSGLKCAIISKNKSLNETNTYYAQGGIIAYRKNDRPEDLAKDVILAGNSYNNMDAVDFFCKKGPNLVFDILIDDVGVNFCKNSDGSYDYTGEAAHSIKRILHYKDCTGEAIQNALFDKITDSNIDIFTDYTAIDLISNFHHSTDTQEKYRPREILGVYVLNNQTGEVDSFFSSKVVLATGGIGALYYYSTNPESATGDGMSMAHRAGAEIINSEFVQFHPTSLFHRDIKRFLISESLRGEGAVLTDPQGKPFMHNYSEMGDLAPRDVVSRAIFDMLGNTGCEYMFLDLVNNYKGKLPIEQRFSKIYNTCLSGGIDISKEPIPIVPAAHYFCGGVKVDLEGQTSLKNLYAVGEVSCTGIHGSNRLASTSLLEGLLWGKSAADSIIGKFSKIDNSRYNYIPEWQLPTRTEEFDPLLIKQDMQAIKLTMWNYAGIIRTSKGLQRAISDLNYYSHRVLKFYSSAVLNPSIIELRNAVVSSQIIVGAASRNKKSIGCHYLK